MKYEQKEGQGALFKNTEKKSEKHPDYRGDITIGGAKFWLSAWIKEGKKGKYMSVSAQPKTEKTAAGYKHNPAPGATDDLDSDVPF